MKKRVLFFFTASYPYNIDEAFIETEMPFLAHAFDKIVIISNESTGHKRETPNNCYTEYFPYNLNNFEKIKALLFTSKKLYKDETSNITKTYGSNINTQIKKIILTSIYKAQKLSAFIKKCIEKHAKPDDEIFLYSYWMNDMAIGCALYKKNNNKINFMCRAHGWDVYFERHTPPYLPFRKFIADNADNVLFISAHGKKYFIHKNKIEDIKNIDVSYLGVKKQMLWPYKREKNTFRIVSCSSIIPLKQVDKIAEAISLLSKEYTIEWTHLGGGELQHTLKNKTTELFADKPHISFKMSGAIKNTDVINYYQSHNIDLFINASSFEGLPVSLMEAFCFGIPAIAPDIGGISEIIDNKVNGYVFKPETTAFELARLIESIIALPLNTYYDMRNKAYEKYVKCFDAEKNFSTFIDKYFKINHIY